MLKLQSFFKLFILSAVSALILSACDDVEIEDGKVPQKYVQQVQPYLGHYVGRIEGKYTEITIGMNGNVPYLITKNNEGGDITGTNCGSKVGKLVSVAVDDLGGGRYQLKRASFDLDPGLCMIEGTTVDLKIHSTTEFDLAILDRDTRSTTCPPRTPSPGSGIPPVDPPCNEIGEITYLRGHFIKR